MATRKTKTSSGWRFVNDELPADKEHVLVWDEQMDACVIAYCITEGNVLDMPVWYKVRGNGLSVRMMHSKPFVAWMPLPEKPEVE